MSISFGNIIGSSSDTIEGPSVVELITPNHGVGVELEIEGILYNFEGDSARGFVPTRLYECTVPSHKIPVLDPNLWRIVKDNSLRNGVEFIFAGPLKGINIIKALEAMQELLNVYRWNNKPAVITDRCSVHVHLDVRDIGGERLQNLLMLYVLIERLLFHYVHPSRCKSTYCRPLTDSSFKYHMITLSEVISKKAETNPLEIINYIRQQCDKYSAFNLLPISQKGSVEFRHHEGSVDMNKVLDWINIILAIKLASAYEPEYFYHTYEYRGPLELIKTIFNGTVLASPEFLEDSIVIELVRKGINDFNEIWRNKELTKLTKITTPLATLDFPYMERFTEFNEIKKVTPPKRPKPVDTANIETVHLSQFLDALNNIDSTPHTTPTPPPDLVLSDTWFTDEDENTDDDFDEIEEGGV